MVGDSLPSVLPHAPVAEHLEILDALLCLGRLSHQAGGETRPLEGELGNPAHLIWRSQTEHIQDRRCHVYRVAEIRSDGAGVRHPIRPCDDQGISHPPGVSVLLVPLERGVAHLTPAHRIYGIGRWSSEASELAQLAVQALWSETIHPSKVVGRALRPTLERCPVVGHQHEERVVEASGFLQGADQPAELCICVLQHAGIDLLKSSRGRTLTAVQLVPRPHPFVSRSQHRAFGHDAELNLAGKTSFPLDVPPMVEAASVVLDEILGGVQG